jgi:hypothetical protein
VVGIFPGRDALIRLRTRLLAHADERGNLVRMLRPLRTVHIDVGGHPITAALQIIGNARRAFRGR